MTETTARPAANRKPEIKAIAYSRPSPSRVVSVADAVTIKRGSAFLLAQQNGDLPVGEDHGYGFYFLDCRFLDHFCFRLEDQPLTPLVASSVQGFAAYHELANRELSRPDGTTIPERSITVILERTLEDGDSSNQTIAHQALSVRNYNVVPVDLTISLEFDSHFRDIYDVRGLVDRPLGTVERRLIDRATAVLAAYGIDRTWRSLAITFDPRPDELTTSRATFQVRLAPGGCWDLMASLVADVSSDLRLRSTPPRGKASIATLQQEFHAARRDWCGKQTQVRSSNPLFDVAINQSLADIWLLRTALDREEYVAAGLPWFGTLFGRDSAITAIQTLAYDYVLAEKTLRVLAAYQGKQIDPWRNEAPGKILHELRQGELARANVIPGAYYGSVDSTPLFLILVGLHYAWAGNLRLFRELRPQIEAALAWIDTYGDHDGDGFLDYDTASVHGLTINQGWKDSGDAIVNADGSLAVPPIALVEVQGYVYLAKRLLAELFHADGQPELAARLERQATSLKERFNQRFWLPDRGFYCLAIQKDGRPAAVPTSNPGQALWGEIVAPERAPRIEEMLRNPTLFSGWGVRTLASDQIRFNPIGYHLGTVWPHDNSLIAAGLRKYRLDELAREIFTGAFEASRHFAQTRMPELFAGIGRNEFDTPAHYPVACHPQAWAAGALPYLLQTALGLAAEAPRSTLRVIRPDLPSWLDWVLVSDLRVGEGSATLRFSRQGPKVEAQVIASHSLNVVVGGANR